MTESDILKSLLENTYTVGQLHRRLRLLRELLEHQLFTTGEDTTKSPLTTNAHATEEDIAVTAHLAGTIAHDPQKEKLYHAVKAKEDTINELPKIILYVPVSFADRDLRAIGTWFRTNISPDTLIDIQVDASLIAGVAIVRNGTFRDYSLSFFLKKSRDVMLSAVTALASSPKEVASPDTLRHPGNPGEDTAQSNQQSL